MTSFVDRDAKLCILMMLQSIIVMVMNSGDFFTVLQAAHNFVLIMASLGGDEDGDYIMINHKENMMVSQSQCYINMITM